MLIKCNECGKEVSDKANTCPNCGAPVQTITQEKSNNHNLEIILSFFIPLIGLILFFIFISKNKKLAINYLVCCIFGGLFEFIFILIINTLIL